MRRTHEDAARAPRSRHPQACLARFRADRSGNVAILFAVMAVVLMLGIGAAIDIGRWLHARDQTIAAIDAAVLAGGRSLQTNSDDTAGAIAAAQKFYNAERHLAAAGGRTTTVTFGVADDGNAMTASGTAYIKTPFLQFANIDKLPLINRPPEFSKAERTDRQRNGDLHDARRHGLDGGQKLKDLKDAAKDLVNIVRRTDQSKSAPSRARAVLGGHPPADDHRPEQGARRPALPSPSRRSPPARAGDRPASTYYLSDCVVERTGIEKYTDAAPSIGPIRDGALHRKPRRAAAATRRASAPSRRAPRSCR